MRTILLVFASLLIHYPSISQEKENLESYGMDKYYPIKCATFLDNVKLHGLLSQDIPVDSNGRYIQEYTYSSSSGQFLIHYDIRGNHSVDDIDENQNSIPDYVENVAIYLDYSYTVSVNELGYEAPYKDGNYGGSDQYDVHLVECGDLVDAIGFYGYVQPDPVPFNKLKWRRYHSYMVIDNNFSRLDSSKFPFVDGRLPTYTTTGIEAVKITTMHEFHHMIQVSYGEAVPTTRSLNELTSTWLESFAFPEIKDYLTHARNLLKNPWNNPFGKGYAKYGYSNNIFGQYLISEFDENILLRMWERILKGERGYEALNNSLIENSSSLELAWCEFIDWLYFTDDRTISESYFPDAHLLPSINFNRDSSTFNPPSFLMSGQIQSYEVRPIRIFFRQDDKFTTDDTLDIILVNTDTRAAIIQQDTLQNFNLAVSEEPISKSIYLEELDKYLYIEESDFICYNYYQKPGNATKATGIVFPNPFLTSKHNRIYFPTPGSEIELGRSVDLKIFNENMLEIYSGKHIVTNINDLRVVEWDSIPDDLNSGIYLYTVTFEGDEKLGKFAVIKK